MSAGTCNITPDNYITGRDRCAPGNLYASMLGAAASISLACLGSAYGTAKSGIGVMSAGVMRPNAAMKNSLPVIMAGVLGIYGLIVSITISTGAAELLPQYVTSAHLAAGISNGLACLAAGIAIGVGGNAAVRAVARQPRLFVAMLLILVFGEALALYGMIVSLILALTSGELCPQICGEGYGTNSW
eukprot:gnl/Chilomastix_caulleri/391.p1 GENE.gnl/Chilomastix_caulleri/391~~gnl/Chilomastix_caulleri/391.p1  ORF type:complete len:187 (+),score=62.21 gnl/Chilomastix_caulleri/391:150-710(+)